MNSRMSLQNQAVNRDKATLNQVCLGEQRIESLRLGQTQVVILGKKSRASGGPWGCLR